MNKKIAMSAISIVSALTIMGGATFAAFSDSATLTNNTFAAGTAELHVSKTGDPAEFGTSVPGFTGAANFFPGHSEVYNFWLRNSSDVDIDFDVAAELENVTGGTEIQANLEVSFTCDAVTAGPATVDAWEAGGLSIATVDHTEILPCTMTVTLPVGASTDVQGQDVNFDVVFTGTQITP